MASKAKRIDVGGGYAVRFTARGRGDETPYWRGEVWQGDQLVGAFWNDGRGGQTIVQPAAARDALVALVRQADPAAAERIHYELEDVVLQYAEARGYDRGARDLALAEYVRAFAASLGPGGTP